MLANWLPDDFFTVLDDDMSSTHGPTAGCANKSNQCHLSYIKTAYSNLKSFQVKEITFANHCRNNF